MIHVFLDANVLLGLHALTPREIAEVEKLVALVREGELTLWLPEMVLDEYARNRPRVVAEALKPLRDGRLTVSPPSMADGLPERDALVSAVGATQRAHTALMTDLEKRATERDLPADRVVTALAAVAKQPPIAEVLDRARLRRELRRPPGKADSLGDAINWESLLANVPNGEDVHVVSSDPDFRTPLDREAMHSYLMEEWERVKGSDVVRYDDLAGFLARHFTAIRVPSDIPKVRLIQRLGTSPSFESTHGIIAKLAEYDVFTPEQAALIARNAVRNNQVRWILEDEDVKEFVTRILDTHRSAIGAEYVSLIERCMSGDERPYSSVDLPDE